MSFADDRNFSWLPRLLGRTIRLGKGNLMSLCIGMLLYPRLTQLDLTAPFEVLTRLPGAKVELLWKSLEPLPADSGMIFTPTATLASCPELDILFVPGGPGQAELMDDREVLDFLADRGARARYVTSVCTGSLLLAAAGLLDGFEATTHWAYVELLPLLGAIHKKQRVVVDRNRVTAGGVTAGIDFGLRLAAEIAGDEVAKTIQLSLEYDPAPPFQSGHPDVADPALVARLKRDRYDARVDAQRQQIERSRRSRA